jgi:tRNA dimethylallyltransferase
LGYFPPETVIIVGPTGAGKTDFACRLAQRLCGEIVGADAFQIYAGFPLLTAQPSSEQQAAIPHHLIGVIDPRENFDAGRYQRLANPILKSIVARGNTPLVVGGTGLYLKALLGYLDELPLHDLTLREEFSRSDLPSLVERLQRADAEAGKKIDLLNRRRVERALEIILLTGKPLAFSYHSLRSTMPLPVGVRALFIHRDKEDLHARITANVAAMFTHGVEAEVAALPEKKIGMTARMMLGLREIQALQCGKISRTEAMAAITLATRRYAKRQMTWFRNQHSFPQLNLSHFTLPDQPLEEALRLLREQRLLAKA